MVPWICALAASFIQLERYASTPGAPADPPKTWPSLSSLARALDAPTLVVTLHPSCPCSRATISELDRIVARSQGHLLIYVLFDIPEDLDPSWVTGESLALVGRIPGIRVVIDRAGRESALFDAKTSGQVVLYDERGDLRFRGGITPARAHAGDSIGRAVILDLIHEGRAERTEAPVFGCELTERKQL